MQDTKLTKREWLAAAYPAFVRAIKRQRKPFLIEQIRAAIAGRIPAAKDDRWFGGLTRKAASDGLITKAGTAEAVSSNYSLKPTWRIVRG